MARRRLPALSEEDRALWDALKQSVTPMHGAKDQAVVVQAIVKAPKPAPSKKPKSEPDLIWQAPGKFAAAMRTTRPKSSSPRDLREGGSKGLDRSNADRLRRGKMPIEGKLDLHGLTQVQAQDRLEGFVLNAVAAGKRHLLVITGKGAGSGGQGVLRKRVPEWLGNAQLGRHVLAFSYAQKRDGEHGALYVLLRRSR